MQAKPKTKHKRSLSTPRLAALAAATAGMAMIVSVVTANATPSHLSPQQNAAAVADQAKYNDPMATVNNKFLNPQAAKAAMSGMHMNTATGAAATSGSPDSSTVLKALTPATGGKFLRLSDLPQAITLPGKPGTYAVNAVHSVMGMNGKILLMMGSGNSPTTFAAGTFAAFVWSPYSGILKSLTVPTDMFCSGHVLMGNGLAIAAGGTAQYGKAATATTPALPWLGAKTIYTFNFTTEEFTLQDPMQKGRWYPTLTREPGNQLLITGGYDEAGLNSSTSETYNETSGMSEMTTGTMSTPFASYPDIFYVSGTGANAKFFYSGIGAGGNSHQPGFWYPYNGGKFVPVTGLRAFGHRSAGTSCWFGDIRNRWLLTMGGFSPATNTTDEIKLNDPSPHYFPIQNLPSAVGYESCVQLPNGALEVTGGGSANAIPNASRAVSIYTYVSGQIRNYVQNPFPAITGVNNTRLYHSAAYLIDTGAVVSYGSNPVTPTTPLPKGETVRSQTVENNYPAYLYRTGNRPMFTSTGAPSAIHYGSTYKFTVTGGDVQYVSVQSPPAPTHDQDVNTRLVRLPVVKTSTPNVYSVTMSFNGTDVLPGPVRLWALSSAGKWGYAKWTTLS